MSPRPSGSDRKNSKRPTSTATVLRIIGGKHRGRQLTYSGDKVTRPMKDDVRESLFNLVGGWMEGKWAVDLFSGTGAVGLEAISRGAIHATLVERHFPTARLIRENARSLGEADRVSVETSDAFFWTRQFMKSPQPPVDAPWVIFCCPPWPLFMHQKADMLALIQAWFDAMPADSLLIVEANQQFNISLLPDADQWKTRFYPPAQVSVFRPAGVNNAQSYERERLEWQKLQSERSGGEASDGEWSAVSEEA